MYNEESGMGTKGVLSIVGGSIFLLCGLIALGMWGCPSYWVWTSEMNGRASQSKAEYERQTLVIEAEAKSKSEVIRAEGVAKANTIIADSLKGNDAYLRYLWIQTMKEDNKTIVYVPTEANLPILEASRFTLDATDANAKK